MAIGTYFLILNIWIFIAFIWLAYTIAEDPDRKLYWYEYILGGPLIIIFWCISIFK